MHCRGHHRHGLCDRNRRRDKQPNPVDAPIDELETRQVGHLQKMGDTAVVEEPYCHQIFSISRMHVTMSCNTDIQISESPSQLLYSVHTHASAHSRTKQSLAKQKSLFFRLETSRRILSHRSREVACKLNTERHPGCDAACFDFTCLYVLDMQMPRCTRRYP